MKDIKDCPFCGGKAEIDWSGVLEFYGHEHQDATITCTVCGAEMCSDTECSCHHDINATVIAKWNNRA